MKKLLFSAAALAVLFAACKSDDNNPTPQTTKLFLNMVSEYDSISVTYNTSNRIVKFSDIAKEEDYASYNEFVYENGRVTKLNASEVSPTALLLSQSYEYNAAGQLLKVKFYDEKGDFSKYDSVAYDNNGRLAALYVSERADEGVTDLKFSEKFVPVWDTKGNIAKQYVVLMADNKETSDTSTTTYTYDDKVNFAAKQPELHLLEPETLAFTLSANNILQEKTVLTNYTITDTNEYTYDEDNYPVTMKQTSVEKNNDGGNEYKRVTNNQIRYIKK